MNRHWLAQRLHSWGDRPALIWRDESWSFTQLCDGCDAWLGDLARHGIKPGDTLAICGDYSPKLCALLLAALLNRNIIVPLASATAPRWNRLMELAQVQFAVQFDSDDLWHVTRFDRAVSNPLLRQLARARRTRSGPVQLRLDRREQGFGARFRWAIGEVRGAAAGLSHARIPIARPYRRHQHAVARALSRRDHRYDARAQPGRGMRGDRSASDPAAAYDADVPAAVADRRRHQAS